MFILPLKRFFPVLIISMFSSAMVQASNTNYNSEDEAQQSAVKQAYVDYMKKCDDLRNAQAALAREQAEKKKREIGTQTGSFFPGIGYKSSLTNYGNVYATLSDVITNQYNEIKQANIQETFTHGQETVKLQQTLTKEAHASLVSLLGHTQE